MWKCRLLRKVPSKFLIVLLRTKHFIFAYGKKKTKRVKLSNTVMSNRHPQVKYNAKLHKYFFIVYLQSCFFNCRYITTVLVTQLCKITIYKLMIVRHSLYKCYVITKMYKCYFYLQKVLFVSNQIRYVKVIKT